MVVGVEVRLGAMVLDLHVHPHLAACIEHFIECGNKGRQVVFAQLRDDATVCQMRIVVHDQLATTTLTHIELDCMRAHFPRTGECRHGVRALDLRSSAMSHDLGGARLVHGVSGLCARVTVNPLEKVVQKPLAKCPNPT